jgi:hypothetical protein
MFVVSLVLGDGLLPSESGDWIPCRTPCFQMLQINQLQCTCNDIAEPRSGNWTSAATTASAQQHSRKRKRLFLTLTTSITSSPFTLIHENTVPRIMEACSAHVSQRRLATVRVMSHGASPIEETRTPPYPSSYNGDRNIEVWPRKMEDRVVGRMIQSDMSSVVPDEATHKYS